MGWCFNIALAVVLVLVTTPHMLCGCGCGASEAADVERRPANGCPHCSSAQPDFGQSGSSRDLPKSCDCDNCDQIPAVMPGDALSVSSPGFNCRIEVTTAKIAALDAQARMPSGFQANGPPSPSPHPSRALPILLGHLLF